MSLPKSKTLKDKEKLDAIGPSQAEMIEKNKEIADRGKIKGSVTGDAITCFGDWVGIIPIAAPDTTSGGISLPNNNREDPDLGVVVGAGPLAHTHTGLDAYDLIGQHVKFGPRNGIRLNSDDVMDWDHEIILVSSRNIYCLVTPRVEININKPPREDEET